MELDTLIHEHTLCTLEQWLASGRTSPSLFRPTFATLAALSLPLLRRGDSSVGGLYAAMAFRFGGPGGPFPEFSRREAARFLAGHPYAVNMAQVLEQVFPDLDGDLRRLLLGDVLRAAADGCMPDSPEDLNTRWEGDLLIRNGDRLVDCRGNPYALILPDHIRTIEPRAFYNCPGLRALVLPAYLEEFSPSCVEVCTNLSHIFIPDNRDGRYFSQDGVLYGREDFSLVCCPPGRQGSFSVPGWVERLAPSAFAHCHRLEDVWLPEGLEEIGDFAFFGCMELSYIHIPDSVKTVGSQAFSCCLSLHRVYFNGPDTEFQEDTFDEDSDISIMAMPASAAEMLANDLGLLTEWNPDIEPF